MSDYIFVIIIISGILILNISLWGMSRILTEQTFVEYCSTSGRYIVNQTIIECEVE